MRIRKKQQTLPQVWAVVAAAGSASRMQGIDKMLFPLAEEPVVIRSIRAFAEHPMVAGVVVVTREALIGEIRRWLADFAVAGVRAIIAGGETRQESVAKGVAALPETAAYVAIHDGARPLVEEAVITEAVLAAIRGGAAAPAVPVKDTIKRADSAGRVTETPPRDGLFAVQTPQVFALGVYRQALAAAAQAGITYTDDCQLVEAMGQPVLLSPGSDRNIKITTPADLAVAEGLLRAEWEEQL